MAKKKKVIFSHQSSVISNLCHHLHHQLCVIKKKEGEKKNQAFGCISAEQVGDGTEQTLFLWVPENLTFFRPPQLTATLSPVVRTGGAQKKKKTASAKIPFQAQREVCQSGARWICVVWPRA